MKRQTDEFYIYIINPFDIKKKNYKYVNVCIGKKPENLSQNNKSDHISGCWDYE